MHKDFTEAKVNAFVCDLTANDLCANVAPSSVDIVTMVIICLLIFESHISILVCNPCALLNKFTYVKKQMGFCSTLVSQAKQINFF